MENYFQTYVQRDIRSLFPRLDLILQGPFGILPIEIKFGTRVKMQQIQTLKKFVKDNELPRGF
ncbi:MAG: hypothetical protein HGJ91_05305 [Desulfobacula sp.]|nr:hypothetical protein [Desulfobacula sp.]